MINFYEHTETGYALRTWENAKRADLTVAIALNFDTPGEKLTQKASYGKYLGLNFGYLYPEEMNCENPFAVETLVFNLQRKKVKVLNGAGNGIYTLKIEQSLCDELVFNLLSQVIEQYPDLKTIRSGGQTGLDQSFLLAADKLSLETICLAPKHWLFRDERGIDIMSEQLFLKRFGYDVMDIL